MEAKLKQLDAERDELAKYQAIDQECRSLEYAIHDKEVSDARTKLEEASHHPLQSKAPRKKCRRNIISKAKKGSCIACTAGMLGLICYHLPISPCLSQLKRICEG